MPTKTTKTVSPYAGYRLAPPPSKAAQKVTIVFGRVPVPVKLYTATEDTKVVRFEATGTGEKANTRTRKASSVKDSQGKNRTVPKSRVYRVATATDGTKVKLSDAEIAALNESLAEGPFPVVAVLNEALIGFDLFPEKVYQVRADDGAEAALTLFLVALQSKRAVAIVNVALNGNAPRPCALTSNGDLLVLTYTDGVREPLPIEAPRPTREELDLASQVLDSINGPTHSAELLVNQSARKVQEFVDARAKDPKLAVPGVAPSKSSVRVTLLGQHRDAVRALQYAERKAARR